MLHFDWITFFGVIFNFSLVVFVFLKWFYKPVKHIIDQREESIREAESKKEEIHQKEREIRNSCQRSIAEAEEQAQTIISGANDLSEEIVNKAKENAHVQAKNMIIAAEDEINASLEASNKLLKQQALKMAQTISNGVISSIVNQKMDEIFIMSIVKNIDQTKIVDKTNRSITFSEAVLEAYKTNSPILIYTTRELPWEIKEELHKKISSIKHTTPIIEFEKNESMSGGIIIDFGFIEVDFSLNGQIHSIVEQLA
ncbi:MAG TPA: F0F1 ATP synthase subunit delta [Caldisericia bacterium]|nr:F0F1 ATP synthase subunit delta [Caldisericia bacterium]